MQSDTEQNTYKIDGRLRQRIGYKGVIRMTDKESKVMSKLTVEVELDTSKAERKLRQTAKRLQQLADELERINEGE